MPTYEIVMQIDADDEDEARAIAVERIQRNDGFEIDDVDKAYS
ncbi:Uncharacterised protein (plasmid) [Tsukamurella tyrosinosolvens]|uniref:Uncharacterized protein n=1 Tax=Tsukamurella tyrosinosolvens TaxID=57704 RepID=A0A1H4V6Z5_TSUTY|nr:hypothetical protein [Tsukamurella tyrosinosolvens]SEC76859.1 hypothetical protein SAMN04489793_3164 [Tsukamurella tyrosinosolvens]VEH90644.1 Uncharacterised protein [Tsukamurella tyrosinosolvens]